MLPPASNGHCVSLWLWFDMEFGSHIRGHWFVVARSEAIRTKPTRVFFLGWPIALARLHSGVIVALEDKCPHRGVPLSDGTVGPMGLSCRFHGWTFDHTGRCTMMPGMSDDQLLDDIRVRSFSVVERDGLIWIGRANANPLPARVTAMQSTNQRFVWQSRWSGAVVEAQEKFLGTRRPGHGTPSVLGVVVNIEGDGFKVDYEPQSASPGIEPAPSDSRVARERAYFSSISSVQREYRFENGSAAWLTVCFTPETLLSTLLFATLHAEGEPRHVKRLVWPFLRAVADQQHRVGKPPDGTSEATACHAPAIAGLDVVRAHLEAAWSGSLRHGGADESKLFDHRRREDERVRVGEA